MRICALGASTSNHVVGRAKVFADFGHDVTLVSPASGDGVVTSDMGIELIDCVTGLTGRFAVLRKTFSVVFGQDADVYHAHYAAEPTTWAAWLLQKKPLIITVMGGDVLFDEQGSLGPIGRWLTRRAVLGADLITVKSPMLGDVVASWGVPRERILDIVWGVDRRVYHSDPKGAQNTRKTWRVDPGEKIILSPRMLRPLYNQNLMVETLPKILEREPNARLVISTHMQDSRYRQSIEALATELGILDKITFVSPVSSHEMKSVYSAADVVLSIASSDGAPQSVMEAMACGVPVIQTDLDRFKPLFGHKDNCWLSALEPEAIADGVCTLLGDRDLRQHITENAITTVKDKADFESQARIVEARMKEVVKVA